MPTGYTARLYDGPQEFKDFVRGAARGMGAFVHLREASSDTPLTYPPNDVPRVLAEFKDALRENTRWRLSSEEDKYAQWSEYVTETEQRIAERDNSEFYARRARFDAMIERVKSVDVPDKLQTFKDFMLQQLGTEFRYGREPYVETIQSYPEWCDNQGRWLQRKEEIRREDYRRTRERYEEVCEYIDLLGKTFGFEVEKQ